MYCRERFELEAEGTGESGVYPASSGRISSTAQRRNRIAKQIDRVPVSKSRPVGKGRERLVGKSCNRLIYISLRVHPVFDL